MTMVVILAGGAGLRPTHLFETLPARSHCIGERLMHEREAFPQALAARPRDNFEGAKRQKYVVGTLQVGL